MGNNIEKEKRQLGITLVALVITIIILLILAGITITQLANNGLFEKAQEAKERSDNAIAKEEIELAKYDNEINNYISGNRDTNVFRDISNKITLNDGVSMSCSCKYNDEMVIGTIAFVNTNGTWNENTYYEIGKIDTELLPQNIRVLTCSSSIPTLAYFHFKDDGTMRIWQTHQARNINVNFCYAYK